jgi:Replication initiator protein A
MKRTRQRPDSVAPLITTPVGVDLIRFEKNLLQMGFFGAHDTRHTVQATRRIEQLVNRDGHKITVAAEFRASQAFGLPSTSDRDKYIAFMRIAMEQKRKQGVLENPVRFTGYQLLKELGLSYSGENYEDINRWGQRMADTTITSEQVIYLAARKKFANTTVHVFRSFTRAGQSSGDGNNRTEAYEVVLEDWLLENLNQSYVVPEDFNAYRKLKRPTAKGIFGYLHLWFHASQGRPVEKDYGELCMLLNIPAYKHLSKIRETMGRSLDELASVGYLSQWDVRPMATKLGYKLVLQAGEDVLRVLALSQRKQIASQISQEPEEQELTNSQEEGLKALLDRGISAAKAIGLVRKHRPERLLKQVEFAEFLMARDKRKKFENPAGFIIYVIENDLPVPTEFVTTRPEHDRTKSTIRAGDRNSFAVLRDRYDTFVQEEIDRALQQQFPGSNLEKKVQETVKQRRRSDEIFRSMRPAQQIALAQQLVRHEMEDTLTLPSFEEWSAAHPQLDLF